MIATTTIISTSVTPRSCLFVIPADNVRIIPVAARQSIAAERNDVRLVAMIAGIFVLIGMTPWIQGNILRQVGPGPLVCTLRLHAQSLQSLLCRRKSARIELVGAQRRHEAIDLRVRRDSTCFVA